MKNDLTINPVQETKKIVSFLRKTFKKQNIFHAVLGLSGGIDSATSLFLLSKALPVENIHVFHIPYFLEDTSLIEHILQKANIPQKNLHIISIKEPTDALKGTLKIEKDQIIRLGNIMARIRMITLFDFAKKMNALVVGTENKSEYHLAYFTRFGDEASDIEPIQHLYKTQIIQLAQYLQVPQFVIDAKPTAGLWEGQTDESEFGFTYEQADQVMYLYFDKKQSLATVKKQFPHAEKIISWCKKNDFKHHVPYRIQ